MQSRQRQIPANGRVRRQAGRNPILGDGVLHAPLVLQNQAQIVVGQRVIRLYPQRLAIAGGGFLQPAKLMKRAAQDVLRLGVRGLQIDDAAVIERGVV